MTMKDKKMETLLLASLIFFPAQLQMSTLTHGTWMGGWADCSKGWGKESMTP
jgi:hypothetical protein